jgi:hypothetical protein
MDCDENEVFILSLSLCAKEKYKMLTLIGVAQLVRF